MFVLQAETIENLWGFIKIMYQYFMKPLFFFSLIALGFFFGISKSYAYPELNSFFSTHQFIQIFNYCGLLLAVIFLFKSGLSSLNKNKIHLLDNKIDIFLVIQSSIFFILIIPSEDGNSFLYSYMVSLFDLTQKVISA